MSRYSKERKQAILSKLSPPHNLSVSEVARSEGIGVQTLYNWRNQAREQGQPMPGNKNTPDSWSSEAKLATIIDQRPSLANTAVVKAYMSNKSKHGEPEPYQDSIKAKSRA